MRISFPVHLLFLLMLIAGLAPVRAQLFPEMVTVGDVGNAPDEDGYGAVAYEFRIGKYEVTIGEYAAFLNAVAAVTAEAHIVDLWHPAMTTDLNVAGISRAGSGTSVDPFSYAVLGNGLRPITYVSWFDAARFVNWLHNGGVSVAGTETGAYTLDGATAGSFSRNEGATWFLPGEDEWYKAAAYRGGGLDAGYWLYPTQSTTAPNNTIGSEPQNANYYIGSYSTTQDALYEADENYLTEGGAFSGSAGVYGTFDMAGNVAEWNDHASADRQRVMGGAWNDGQNALLAYNRSSVFADLEFPTVGFRVATIPEPGSVALVTLAGAGWGLRLWRRRQGQ